MAQRIALIVEDSPSMRQLVAFSLKRIPDLSILEANNGLEALKALASNKIDIMLVDLNMPEMDGLKLVATVRAEERTKNVPIVIITTEGNDEDRNRALSLGATAYLTKPIQNAQVLKTVSQLLGV